MVCPFNMMESDPDQLLKTIEAQIALIKARHARATGNRNVFRIMSILFIVLGAFIAIILLQYMASQIPANSARDKVKHGEGTEK